MKQGKTVLEESVYGSVPRVLVGTDDRVVRVEFGTFSVLLHNIGDVYAVTVRADAHDVHGAALPVVARIATDVRGQVEFRLTESGHDAS